MSTLAPPVTVEDCLSALRTAWCGATSSDPEWSPGNPSLGQCAVTALVVQDLFGGTLLRAEHPGGSHYWNLLPDGSQLDLTRDQFGPGVELAGVAERDRDYLLGNSDTELRYLQLRSGVERSIPLPQHP